MNKVDSTKSPSNTPHIYVFSYFYSLQGALTISLHGYNSAGHHLTQPNLNKHQKKGR